jgi:tripartite-type tricarboxylate transporter receptor subunit TctC
MRHPAHLPPKRDDLKTPLHADTPSRRQVLLATAAGVAAWASGATHAQADRATRIVLPYPAGNTIDASARVFAEAMRITTQRNFYLDNKTGASGMLGTAEVARARPDGSVLLYTTGIHTVNAVLHAKPPYDVRRDFTPITQLSVSRGYLVLVRADSPFRTLEDVVRAAKDKPGRVTYGSWGIGNTTHLVAAIFVRAAGLDLLHVPYRGSPFLDLFGGQIDLTWYGSSLAMPLVKEGKVRALATTYHTRLPDLPDVPTMAELGFKDVDIPAWSGVFGPAGMPKSLVDSIYTDIVNASRQPALLENRRLAGGITVNMPPTQFAAAVNDELETQLKIFPSLNIRME